VSFLSSQFSSIDIGHFFPLKPYPLNRMKVFAVLILLSLTVLANAVIIPPAFTTRKEPRTPEVKTDLDGITRGNVKDAIENNNYGIVARGNVEDKTILERDEIPDHLERRVSLWVRGLAFLQRRETDIDATDRLCFSTSISSFLAAKAMKKPSSLIWDDDGCSNSPDKPGGFNFLPSCQRHDFGYRNFKEQGRFTKANRKRIDDNLKNDMDGECDKHGFFERSACKTLAKGYYEAVREFGGT